MNRSCSVSIIVGVLLGLTPVTEAGAQIDAPAVAFPVVAGVEGVFADNSRRMVELWSRYHSLPEVRDAAWLALHGGGGDTAIADFVRRGGGYDQAVTRSDDDLAMNNAIIAEILRTTPRKTHLWSTADRVADRPDREVPRAAKHHFVQVDMPAAKTADAANQELITEIIRKQDEMDRRFVAWMSHNAPGEQVRTAAIRAVADGTDAGFHEFFARGWASGAELDRQNHQMSLAHKDAELRRQTRRLIVAAREAEAALRGLEGAMLAKAKQEAALKWHSTAEQAEAAQRAWAKAREDAHRQASYWREVADKAVGATTNQDWQKLADMAKANTQSWHDDAIAANSSATDWNNLAREFRLAAEKISQ